MISCLLVKYQTYIVTSQYICFVKIIITQYNLLYIGVDEIVRGSFSYVVEKIYDQINKL